jgi:hypothetical protein
MYPDIDNNTEIRTYNPSRQAAADPYLTPRGYWDRQAITIRLPKVLKVISYSTQFLGYKEIGTS